MTKTIKTRVAPCTPSAFRLAAEQARQDQEARCRRESEARYQEARRLEERAPVNRLLAGLVDACSAAEAEARCLTEHGERWRALYRTPWARYEATLAVPELTPLRRLAREELGDQAPASDAAYQRSWYEASRWSGGGIAPEDRRQRWLDS